MSIETAFFGVVAKDAEPRVSSAGKPYMRINVRVGDGDSAQWILVTVFGDTVAALRGRAVKGAKLYCEGRLTLENWQGKDGNARHGLAVAAWKCEPPQIGRNRQRAMPEPANDPVPFNDAHRFLGGRHHDLRL